jgi:hypothetical protein
MVIDGNNSFTFISSGYVNYIFDGNLTDPGPQTLTYSTGTLFPGSNLGTLTSPGVVNGARTYTETSTPTEPSSPYEISFTIQDPTAPGTYSGFGDEAVELFSNLDVNGDLISTIIAPLTAQIDENIVVCFDGPCTVPPDPGMAATPELSGLVLVATGVGGIAGALVRRRRTLC